MSIQYILVDAWNTLVTEDGINNQMLSLLNQYETRKVIVTNATEEEKIKLGIVEMPYPVFSLAHQPNKTDPIYFTRLLSYLSVTYKEVIYFDHNPKACEAAISLGIKTHFHSKGANLIHLVAFLDKYL
jgi:FMN phosphatase YigB (HAD superfamily)